MRNVSSIVQLQDAIRKLEAFSKKAAENSHSSPLSKTIGFVRFFWRQTVEGKKKFPMENDKNELIQAVEVVNRERLKIQKMQKGSPAEQKLAHALTVAIEAYNKHAYAQPLEGKGLSKFLSEKLITSPELPKIHLPQQLTVTYHYPRNLAEESATQCAMNAMKPMALALSKQSTELFQMKVLALLERYGIASNPEARALVKGSPIQTEMKADEVATCTLTQTLTLFPGQTIVVKGRSELDPKTRTISRLFPDTFFVSLESTQTAFPHPSQRSGWALVNQLLPDCPQRMDLLGSLADLFQNKKKAMQALLPQGELIDNAKQLLKLKKRIFAVHQAELIGMHHQLAKALLNSAPVEWLSAKATAIVDDYYQNLPEHSHVFDFLVDTNHTLVDIFISQPHHMLYEAILKGKHTEFGSANASTRFQEAQRLLCHGLDLARTIVAQSKEAAETAHEKIKWAYIECVGEILGRAAQNIILQYFSEDLVFEPPGLNLFESQVQAIAYDQVADFLMELNLLLDHDKEKTIYNLLKQQLYKDLAVFQGEGDLRVPALLAEYFKKRYTSLVAKNAP